MEEEPIELSARERERLKVLHEVEQGHLRQIDAAHRLRLSARQLRRLLQRLHTGGDRGLAHGLRGARAEIERRLDGSHWLRFRGRYLRCAPVRTHRVAQVLPAYGLQDLCNENQDPKQTSKPNAFLPPDHPWRTFQFGRKTDIISTLR